MKTKSNIRRITEPMMYFAMVAVFGFVTTVVNQTNREEKLKEAETVTLNNQEVFSAMFGQEGTASL